MDLKEEVSQLDIVFKIIQKQRQNPDPIIEGLKSAWLYPKKINRNYGNLLLTLVTAFLVYVTYEYVQLTRDSLKILENQLEIIRKDYQVRSYPEITINAPTEYVQGEKKGMQFFLYNSGFQATGVKVKVIVCYDRNPQPKEIGLLYQIGDRPFYVEQEVSRLANESYFQVFIAEEDYQTISGLGSDLGFLIFVKYNVPLKDEPNQEHKYFQWNEKLKMWQGYADENISDIMARVYDEKILDDF